MCIIIVSNYGRSPTINVCCDASYVLLSCVSLAKVLVDRGQLLAVTAPL